MRKVLLGIVGLMFFALPATAQTADEIVAKYIKTIGGMEKIQAIKTVRLTEKFTGGGGFEAAIIGENKRPNKTREEFSLQGMIGVTAKIKIFKYNFAKAACLLLMLATSFS